MTARHLLDLERLKHSKDLLNQVGLSAWIGLLGFSFLLSGLMSFLLPPFQAPDEIAHWQTANLRFDKLAGIKNSCHAATRVQDFLGVGGLPFHAQNKVATGFFAKLPEQFAACDAPPGEIDYGSFLSYPSVTLARLLITDEETRPDRAVTTYYAAKWVSILTVLLSLMRLTALSMKRIGAPLGIAAGTAIILAMFTSPMALQQYTAVTADSVIMVATIWCFLVFVHFSNLKWMDFVFFAISGAAAIASKPTLGPLLALPMVLVLINDFATTSHTGIFHRWIRSRSRMGLVVATGLFFATGLYTTLNVVSGNPVDKRVPESNKIAQMEHIRKNPLEAVKVLSAASEQLIEEERYMYQSLGWLDTAIAPKTILLHKRLMGFVWIIEIALIAAIVPGAIQSARRLVKTQKERTIAVRWLCAMGAALLVVFLFNYLSKLGNSLALYLGWTPVGANYVSGLQGRYFFSNSLIQITFVLVIVANFLHHFDLEQASSHQSDRSPQKSLVKVARFLGAGTVILLGLKYGPSLILDLAIRYW